MKEYKKLYRIISQQRSKSIRKLLEALHISLNTIFWRGFTPYLRKSGHSLFHLFKNLLGCTFYSPLTLCAMPFYRAFFQVNQIDQPARSWTKDMLKLINCFQNFYLVEASNFAGYYRWGCNLTQVKDFFCFFYLGCIYVKE